MASSKGKSKKAKATTAKTAKAKTTKATSSVRGKKATPTKAKAKTAKPKAKAKSATKKTAPVKKLVKTTGVKKAAKKAVTKKKVAAKPKTARKAAKPRNRRLFDRRNTHIQAELDHDGALTKGTVTNLSLAGCLFQPRLEIAIGSRIKLKLAGETKPVPATVKGVSELGVHCLLHAGGVTLGNLAADLDDMALLMLNAARPHVIAPKK